MADSGCLEAGDVLVGVVQVGDSPLDRKEVGELVRNEGGDLDSPKIRRSARKKPLRSLAFRGRITKSSPKSPLMRMVEMRKGGLRGRDLRLPGLEGPGSKSCKGLKGSVRRGSQVLEAVPEMECIEAVPGNDADVLVESLEGEGVVSGDKGLSGDVAEMVEDQSVEEPKALFPQGSSSWRSEDGAVNQLEAGVMSDLALDLIVAQPLQEMAFIGEQVTPVVEWGTSGKDSFMEDVTQVEGERESLQDIVLKLGTDKDFPPLSKEGLRMAKEKEKNRGEGGKEAPRVSALPPKEKMDRRNEDLKGGSTSKGDGNKWAAGKNYKASLAEGSFSRGNMPVSFEPEKIKRMGVAGESSGLPSIHFSGVETSFLAEKMGFAIVGKFSHSIPSSLHLQRAFQGMRFLGEFSWRYINAKHVLVQFHLIDDYAKLLSGPNGMPVWFVDRHPMRVFKWTPDFDPFFESPIAAVWCNLVGLPIHLFEKSALFAIGSLLGEPLQVDHATITRSRLSFARLCIEIDISQTPVQEIILDLQGREVRQVVKWDRIPLYCHECKHVGHSIDVCYANGQREKPARRDYKLPSENRFRQGSGAVGGNVGSGLVSKDQKMGAAPLFAGQEAPVGLSSCAGKEDKVVLEELKEQGDGGFQQQGRRRGKQGIGVGVGAGLKGGSPGIGRQAGDGGWVGGEGFGVSENRFSVLCSSDYSLGSLALEPSPRNRYMKLLPNGDFDPEEYEDEKDCVSEEDSEEESSLQQGRLEEKRGAGMDLEKLVEDNKAKKGRLDVVVSSATV